MPGYDHAVPLGQKTSTGFWNGPLVPFTIATECFTGRAMHIEETTTLLEATRPASACVIDFFEARDRLKPGLEEAGQQSEIRLKSQKLALYRLPSVERADRLEESSIGCFPLSCLLIFCSGS